MVIQHNIPALNSHRNLGINNNATAKNLEKLSSGYRINRAGDDAAGLAISEKMRGQIRGLGMAEQNASHGINLIQTAEGGLNETHSILQRMRELAVQSSNATYQEEDRLQIEKEFQALKSEIDRIATSTHYNGIKVLDGTTGGIQMKHGIPMGDVAATLAAMGVNYATGAGNVINPGTATISIAAAAPANAQALGFTGNYAVGTPAVTATYGGSAALLAGSVDVSLEWDDAGSTWKINLSGTSASVFTGANSISAAGITLVDAAGNSVLIDVGLGAFTSAPARGIENGTTIDIGTVAWTSAINAGNTSDTTGTVTGGGAITGNLKSFNAAVTDATADLTFTFDVDRNAWLVNGSMIAGDGTNSETFGLQGSQSIAIDPTTGAGIGTTTLTFGTGTNTITLDIDNTQFTNASVANVNGQALLNGSFTAQVGLAGGATTVTAGAAGTFSGNVKNQTTPDLTTNQKLVSRMLASMGLSHNSALTLAANSLDFDEEDAYLQVRPLSDAANPGRELVLQIGDETFYARQSTAPGAAAGDIEFFRNVWDDTINNWMPEVVATMNDVNLNGLTSNGTVSFNIRNGEAITTIRDSMIATEDVSALKFQIGANGAADQRVGLFVANMSSMNIGIITEAGKTEYVYSQSVATQDDANKAIEVLNGAIIQVAGQRAELGALQNRLEHTLNNLGVTKENLTAAESTIRDVDMAKEMMEFTKNNILVQAAQAMLAQANQLPQGVLSLLR